MRVSFTHEDNIRIEDLTLEDFEIINDAMELKIQYPDSKREKEIQQTLLRALEEIKS